MTLEIKDVSLLISGLGLEMNEPPVSIAGEIVKTNDSYFGGVSMSLEPYSFMGGGYYGRATANKPTKDKSATYETLFVFAMLNGPFAELEFASLEGLKAGFGHNSEMTLPTVDNVTSFPFLSQAVTAPGNDPLAVINSFTGKTPPPAWFSNADGEMWMAAGLTATALHTLDVDCVLTLDVSSSDVVIGLFAHATATVPPEAKSEAEMFARVDMGLLAVLDWAKGIFKVEGQLTPKSFILDKDCKLKGGFALCYFFTGSGHDGDWVFTIGGYHPSFTPPSWYPVPSRVGISWILDSSISISGEAYFAITPKCCMGGGKLDLTFNDGNLHAWFDAYADFLVNYSPFSFQADMGISIGIKYTCKIAFVVVHFNVGFGCSLYIHGPPVAGYVKVGWSILSFDIHFGDAHETTQPLTWLQFQDLIRQDGLVSDGKTPPPSLLKLTATAGLISSPTSAADTQMVTPADSSGTPAIWSINHAVFSCDVTSAFPITALQLGGGAVALPTQLTDAFGAAKDSGDVCIKPMQYTDRVTSIISISVIDNTNQKEIGQVFQPEIIVKNLPTAMWDAYSKSTDPLASSTPSSAAFTSANSTKPLISGISLLNPTPTTSGPYLALNTLTSLSYDAFINSPIPCPSLPSPTPPVDSPLQATPIPLTPIQPSYNNVKGQSQALDTAIATWAKLGQDGEGDKGTGLQNTIGKLMGLLGVPAQSKQGRKMAGMGLPALCKPPKRWLADAGKNYPVPPLVGRGWSAVSVK